MYRNRLESLDALSGVFTLQYLDLGRNNLTKIDALPQHFPLLSDLILYSNRIEQMPHALSLRVPRSLRINAN